MLLDWLAERGVAFHSLHISPPVLAGGAAAVPWIVHCTPRSIWELQADNVKIASLEAGKSWRFSFFSNL